MSKSFRSLAVLLGLAAAASAAHASSVPVYITEWAYNGVSDSSVGGEYIEFTNLGTTAVDFTGWSFDDDSRTPGSVDLSGFGLVAAGESVVLSEASADDFRAAWGLDASVKVVGKNDNNLGRNDEINLYDRTGGLIDRLTFGDQNFPGSVRTNGKAGLAPESALGTNDVSQWFLAVSGDAYGSHVSTAGSVGNPGLYPYTAPAPVPLPAGVWLLVSGLGTMGAAVRRRRAAVA